MAMGPQGLRLDADDRTLLDSDAPIVLRRVEVEDGRFAFETHSSHPVQVRLEHPTPSRLVTVDGLAVAGGGESVILAPGHHRVSSEKPLT